MDNIYILGPKGELYHWGIKGMKWGIRRYQNPDGSLTEAGQKRYDDELARVKAKTEKIRAKQQIKQDREDRKAAMKAAKQELEDARKGKKPKSEEPVESDDAKKERILKNPTPKDVLNNRHLFNDKEIQAVRLRLNEEKMIRDLESAEVSKGQQFVDKAAKTLDNINTIADKGSKTYNSVAKIYNAFLSGKTGVDLPLISDKVKSKLDKYKEETEWLDAKNKRKEAEDKAKPKQKTELEKAKEEAEMAEYIKRRNQAIKDDPDREPTEIEKEAAAIKTIQRQAARRKAENDLRDEAVRKATHDAADEKARKANEERSMEEYDKTKPTPYSNKGRGERTAVNTGSVAKGQELAVRSSNSNALSTNVASKIRSMTSNSNKSYSEIAQQLGVSLSTVQNYSTGRDYCDRVVDAVSWELVGDDD